VVSGVLVLLVALVLLAPTLLAPIVTSRVLGLAAERVDGTVTLEDLSLSLGGHVQLTGLTVTDRQGRPVASLPDVEIQADVFALLGGRVDADVTVRAAQLHLRRDAGGDLNVQALLREPPGVARQASLAPPVASAAARGAPEAGGAPGAGTPLAVADLPDISARVQLSGGTVVLHDEAAATELREIEFAITLDDLERPAPFTVTGVFDGPGGPAGTVRLSGDVTAARDGFVDPARMSAHADYVLEDVRLDGLSPAAALFAPVQQLGGGLSGHGQWAWAGGLAVSGVTEIDLSGPALLMEALGPERRALPSCRLTAEAQLDEAGDGTQSLRFVAGSLLDLRYEGTVAGATGDAPGLGGELSLVGRVDELQAAARGLLPLRTDVGLSGSLALEARFDAALSDAGPVDVSLDARLGIEDLAAHEGGGGKINLGDLTGLDVVLKARAEPTEGRAHLERFELLAGPVSAHARARVSGLSRDDAAFDPALLVVQDGDLAADADLGRLADTLSRFLDLGGLQLAGRLTARAMADGRDGGASAEFDVAVEGLHVVSPAAAGSEDPPAELTVPRLTAHGVVGADARAARIDAMTVRWEGSRVAGLDVPAGDVGLAGSYAMQDGVLDLEEWTLSSSLARGGGRARIAGLAEGSDGPVVSGTISLQGETEPWRALLAGRVPDLASARARGAYALVLEADHEGGVSRIEPTLTLTGVALDGYVLDGQALPLPETDAQLGASISLDTREAGRVEVSTLTFRAPGIDLTAEATVVGLVGATPGVPGGGSAAHGPAGGPDGDGPAGDGPPTLATLDGTWTADPSVLGPRLAVLLGGPALSGERLGGDLAVQLDGDILDAQGSVQAPYLVIDLPADAASETPARRIVQRDLGLRFDLDADLGAGDRLEIHSASIESGTARASVAGVLSHLSTPSEQAADMTLEASASLSRLLADLGSLLPLDGWTAEGAATLTGRLARDAGRLSLTSRTDIEGLRVVVPPSPDAEQDALPTVITDERLEIDVLAAVDVEPLDIDLDHLDLRSSVMRGRLTGRALGLRTLLAEDAEDAADAVNAQAAGGEAAVARFAPLDGDFRYVPSRLGALLSPWLPGTLTGEAEEPLIFHVEGPVTGFDPLALLGSLSADATVGLGTLGLPPGLTTAGTVDVQSASGRAQVKGGLSLNGGRLDLDALLDANPVEAGQAPVSTLHLALDGVQLNQELATLLAHVHPLFAGGEDSELATVTGLLAGGLDVTWNGPLPTADGETDWLSLLGRSLSATGRLAGDQLALTSSPLLADMLGKLGVPASTELSIAPVEFEVRDGRLAYAEPWAWRVSGVDTSFTGSLGLDFSLDLAWNVPVTERMIERYDSLESLKGQAITIPITGTVSDPKLQWDGVLNDLAGRAAKAELEQKAKEKLGDLGGILGEGSKDGEGATRPEELLAEADRLWDEGKREEARVLYREIRQKHKLTLVYALNKKRIKDRADD
jgi:hypothetical protein